MPTILIKRGTNAPGTTLQSGEFGFKTDTNELYIGKGSGVNPVKISTWKEYSSNFTILTANTAETPSALTLGTNTVLGRLSGNISALTGQNVWSLIDGTFTTDINANNQKIVGVALPTNPNHAATKGYVDSLVSTGLTFHEAVFDKDLTSPPGSPSIGDRYWLPASPTGAWAGQGYQIAKYNGTSWDFEQVTDGDTAYVTDENLFYFYDADASGDKRQRLHAGIGNHGSTHLAGGTDEITGNLSANARVGVSNNGSDVGTRRKINFIPGTNVTLSISDNGANERVDVTINATGSGGSTTFVGLTDTPSNYTGSANYLVAVNGSANALIFTNVIDGGTL